MGTVNYTNVLKFSFGLSIFVFLGNLILGLGMYKTQLLPKGNAIVFIIGIGLIMIFPGIENWMSLGSLFLLIGLVPIIKIGD